MYFGVFHLLNLLFELVKDLETRVAGKLSNPITLGSCYDFVVNSFYHKNNNKNSAQLTRLENE